MFWKREDRKLDEALVNLNALTEIYIYNSHSVMGTNQEGDVIRLFYSDDPNQVEKVFKGITRKLRNRDLVISEDILKSQDYI